MLDPLSALSVASAVVTFVDFVAKLIQEADAISSNGSSTRVNQNKILTADLISINATLQARVPPRIATEDALKVEEQALDNIVIECNEIASELILCLERLTTDQLTSRWRSFRAALRTIWTHEKIDDLVGRLDSYRREIALRILVLLNAKSDAQSRRQTKILDGLQRSTKDVVEVISITNGNIQTSLEQQVSQIDRIYEEQTLTAKRQHEETIAAILTLRDGNTQVIAQPHVENALTQPTEAPRRIKKSFTFTEGINDLESSGRSRPPRVTLNDFEPVLKKVLDCLYFRQIVDRVEEISPAYQRTFQWIFLDPKESDKPWNNFVEWLQHGSGCYWINGKAGSGKSTLMKYISHDIRSRRALAQWAGEHNFVTTSFFLWNMGSSLQKSQAGLLRSLLLDVLDRHQGLIPSAFPGLCRYALSHPTNRLVEPSFPELKKAFLNLVNQQSSSLRMCFFIDGIDEYEGDQTELIDLLKEVTSCSPHIKMVLSSRPTPACVEELSEFPCLRLQDLTHDDIQFYVGDRLGKHRNLKNLKLQEPAAVTELIDDISSKASGVFLWVMLVVRSLLQGLRNHDRISDLRRRLDELPEGLETLYEHMLQTMSPIYRQQASQLFQIVMASMKVQTLQPLTLLQVSYAEQEDPKEALALPTRMLTSTVEASRCEATEARIRSRCCGLVEVQEKKRRRVDGTSFNLLCVSFLHKTVVEFLKIERNWSNMLSLNSDLSFDPDFALLSSCVSFVKTTDVRQTATSASAEGLSDICRSLLLYTVLVEDKTAEPQTVFVDEFQRALSGYVTEVAHDTVEPRRSSKPRSTRDRTLGFNKSILFLSLRFGLIRYVTEKLDLQQSIAKSEQGAMLLREAVCQFVFSSTVTGELDTYDRNYYSTSSGCQYTPKFWYDCVKTLLARDIDPNVRLPLFENRPESGEDMCSSWEMVLDLAIALPAIHRRFMLGFEHEDSWSSLYASLLKLIVIHGGEPNAVRVSRLFSGSALSIVERLLTPSWYSQAGSATSLSPACRFAIEAFRSQLTSLLTERHAAQRERLGGKLVTRPPLFVEASDKGHKKQTHLSVKEAAADTSSAMSSPLSPASQRSGESPRVDDAAKQRPRSNLVRGLWAKLTT